MLDAEPTVGMVRPPPHDPQVVDVTPNSAIPCIPVQSSSHIAHTNVSSKNHVTNIESGKRLGLVCISHKVLERNRTVGRDKEGSSVVIPTIYGYISWALVQHFLFEK